ncbi:hypothetical protein AB0N31_04785 [Streptomyces sp. NPDC051051]
MAGLVRLLVVVVLRLRRCGGLDAGGFRRPGAAWAPGCWGCCCATSL